MIGSSDYRKKNEIKTTVEAIFTFPWSLNSKPRIFPAHCCLANDPFLTGEQFTMFTVPKE
jgi:hypothetical protein